jgi:CofD-related protein of GAK system
MRMKITREVEIPDPVKLLRYERNPDLGPRILFFSGGTSLRALSAKLINYTHNSVHIITPFDSGGSSRTIRKAFAMPAVGDIRNRLMALADHSIHGNPEIFELFAHRLPHDKGEDELHRELERMARARHPLLSGIPDPMRKIIRHHLYLFQKNMPSGFDLRGANIGNLVLAAGYLENRRHLDPVIFVFSKLVEVRGIVRPVLNRNLHLAATLQSGKRLFGQHNFTGKGKSKIQEKIAELHLVDAKDKPVSGKAAIRDKIKKLIKSADLICYPMGSFYSSLVANLLVPGVGAAISANPCPKVFVPSTGEDPEAFGMDVADQVSALLYYLNKNMEGVNTEKLLDFVAMDLKNGKYPGGKSAKALKKTGAEIIDYHLVSDKSRPLIDENLLVPLLLSLT